MQVFIETSENEFQMSVEKNSIGVAVAFPKKNPEEKRRSRIGIIKIVHKLQFSCGGMFS